MNRVLTLLLVVGLAAASGTLASAQHRSPQNASSRDRNQQAKPADSAPTTRTGVIPRNRVTFTTEREAAAQSFIRQHRPELVDVLEELKVRDPAEHQRAICDLFWTSEKLAAMQHDEPQRYELALKTWQWEALANLQAAQLAGAPSDAENIKAQLQETVEQLVKAQLEESAYAVRRQEAQLRRAQERQKRLEGRRDELVRERLGSILKAIESTDTQSPDAP